MQWKRVGLAANVTGNDRHGAEFAECAGGAQDHAEQQPPADVGQSDAEENAPAAGAEHQRGLLLGDFLGETRLGEPASLLRRHAAPEVFGGREFQMCGHLLLQLPIELAPPHQTLQPGP